MNNDPFLDPAHSPDFSAIHERVSETVHRHQRRLRLLNGTAFLFGFLAIAASLLIATAYFVLYRPKQMQLLRDLTTAAQEAHPGDATPPNGQVTRRTLDFPSVQATMIHAQVSVLTIDTRPCTSVSPHY